MSLSTLFALTCSSTIAFGGLLIDRLDVNNSESLNPSAEFYTERRRMLTTAEVGYYEWPSCVGNGCTVNNGGCPSDFYGRTDQCHQIIGAVYHADGKCYQALTSCMGCMMPQYRDVRPDALKPVDCSKHRWHGAMVGQYSHKLDNARQFVWKICVRSGSLIDGIKFYYKTPKNDDYSDYIYTESPWYGGNSGSERCFAPDDSIIDQVYIKSAFSINALFFNNRADVRFGGGGGDIEETFYGGVLRSVGVYHGRNPVVPEYQLGIINALKFDWMDDDNANYMIFKMCTTGQLDC